MNLQEIVRLREQAEESNKKAERAAGVLESLRKELLDDYGCKNMEQAEKQATKWQEKLDTIEQENESLLEEWKNQYGDKL